MLRYPSRETLRLWCEELAPKRRKRRVGGIKLTKEQGEKALLSGGENITMPSKEDKPLPDDRDAPLSEKAYLSPIVDCFDGLVHSDRGGHVRQEVA